MTRECEAMIVDRGIVRLSGEDVSAVFFRSNKCSFSKSGFRRRVLLKTQVDAKSGNTDIFFIFGLANYLSDNHI